MHDGSSCKSAWVGGFQVKGPAGQSVKAGSGMPGCGHAGRAQRAGTAVWQMMSSHSQLSSLVRADLPFALKQRSRAALTALWLFTFESHLSLWSSGPHP